MRVSLARGGRVLSPEEWLEEVCHCVRTKVMSPTDEVSGCVLLRGLLDGCAQATGRVQDFINNADREGFPPLAYAIASSSKEAVELLLEYEADPNAMAHGFPLLAYAIVSEADWTVQLLLSYGADPFAVPAQLFMDETRMEAAENRKAAWKAAERDLQLLAYSLNLAMRYWLYQATRLPPLTERKRRMLPRLGLKRLPALQLMLVGQEAALVYVFNAVIVHLMSPTGPGSKKKPLAMLFAGPPGHGKTFLAEELGRLVSAPRLFIDCATTQHVSDMFGCQKPYRGFEEGSTLVNFLSVNEGKRCVVVLDEFEKTEEEVHNGFLRVLDGGEVLDWRDGTQKVIDCSQAIFVMTTNAHDRVIIRAQKKDPSLHHARSLAAAEMDKLLKPLETELKAGNKVHFKPSLASRIMHTIPFIPFNEDEAEVVVSQTLCKLRKSLSRTASEPDEPGDMRMEIQGETKICKDLAAEIYSADLGARSLENTVWDRLKQQVYRKWLDEELNPGSRFKIKPDPLDQDPFLLDLS